MPSRFSVGDERGLANWPAMRPTFTTGEAAGIGQHHRHLQEDAEEIADVVGAVLGEALGAIAALQQESLAGGDPRQRVLQIARLAGKHQRRKGRELLLDVGQRLLVRIIRHLHDRLAAPAIGAPLPEFASFDIVVSKRHPPGCRNGYAGIDSHRS